MHLWHHFRRSPVQQTVPSTPAATPLLCRARSASPSWIAVALVAASILLAVSSSAADRRDRAGA